MDTIVIDLAIAKVERNFYRQALYGSGKNQAVSRHSPSRTLTFTTPSSHEGNGLGLAMVKKVIDITGAKISVISKTGKGTIFTVRLKTAE